MTSDARPPASVPRSQDGLAENGVSQRSPFVGRTRELHELQTVFEAAAMGRGALLMLVGEPGIGKTALCEQLCSLVEASGGTPLVGHCYEEGSFRPPYQPFVEVFGTYLQDCDTSALTADAASSVSDLARIVPMLRQRLRVTPPPPGDPEEDRWRLLQAATDFLRSAAAQSPLLLVLEDLHDADRGTLDLLLYLARNLRGARILVVCTYRDVEVDRAHPLSAALSELHRASNVTRMQLRGLSTDDVLRLLAETSHHTIPHPFAGLVHRQTDGNPLFVHEMLRYVIDAGLMEQRDGALRRVGDQSLAGRIPEGLRDAVGKRLSRLSDSTNRVLSVASVIGREFQLDVLRQVLVIPDEELEATLAEASAAAIIEERSVVGTSITYRFGHAFFRQTLYDEMVAPRRIRLHQQVAHALEEVHGTGMEEHAAELAEHYAFSSDPLDLAKAVHYGELAARRATDVFAYGEAARQLERTLLLLDLADPQDTQKRCDLLLALGEALWPAGDTERVITHVAPDAFALAEKQGDRSRAFRACRVALDCLQAQGRVYLRPEYLRWAELAHGYASDDSTERLYADLALALAWSRSIDRGRRQEASALQLQGLALARELGDTEAMFRSAFSLLLRCPPQRWSERLRLAEEATAWPRQAVSAQSLGLVLSFAGAFQFAQGERARADELWREIEELAERTHVVSITLMAQRDPLLALVDGRLEDALVQWKRLVERADELGASLRGRMIGLNMLHALARYLGRAETWLAACDEYVRMGGFRTTSRVAICLAELGRLEEARALVGPELDEVAASSGDDETPMFELAMSLEAAIAVGHRRAASALMARLDCVAHLSFVPVFQTCVGRHLGDAAVLVGDRTAARLYYVQALEAAGKIRFRPELALTHLRLAELLLDDGNDIARSEALAHLDTAIPELRDMKMQPALERALALSNTYQAPSVQVSARSPSLDGLTAREREIAGLIARGLSNREIGEQLVITEGTVEVHVKHIFSKLGFRSRSQVVSWYGRQHDEPSAEDRT